ncbi:S-adenosyl-L-methionine-dependent methyltransferase [Corynespora cassiicola Philippines]|uniref:S-adenosyl-L-methionine-dependent methyltransferase n=1 Tax=Corynespora cassiicola Philippines TaxID=1448308 RepID=A0A2T2NC34_CORCC|nr:S-adenosyl-L-methionine-dependent methyltransferase [Corynespora cassiicola Philippines]
MASESSESIPQRDKIAQALSVVASEGSKFMDGDLDAREKLIESARDLVTAAETPVESLLWTIWALPTRSVAARVAVELKIFETTVQDGGRPKTDADLAAPTGASPALVKRIARACVSMRMLEEQGPGIYIPNDLTRLLAQQEYAAGIIFWCRSFAELPDYLQSIGFQNPQNPKDGAFQYANHCEGAFEWLKKRPKVFQAFHGYVHAVTAHRPSWHQMYPVHDYLVDSINSDGDSSALVDIGGGTGQTLQDFQASFPEFTGRLILQELPEVIEAAAAMGVDKGESRIELQVHDFFQPQVVKGARAYFMRYVMHDWPDEQCRTILRHIRDAMQPGYSRILINDCVLAEEKAAWQHISLDIFMMAQISAQERTAEEWIRLIDSCDGLKVAAIHTKGTGNEAVIEIIRARKQVS